MNAKILFFVLLLFFVSGCTGGVANGNAQRTPALVMRAIDGDTVELFGGERVRLIGINSTEKGAECYSEAKQKLAALVEGRTVFLEKDVSKRDKYNRLLAYLFVGERFVNLEMVESGFAFAYRYEPDTHYYDMLAKAQKSAEMGKNGCLWAD